MEILPITKNDIPRCAEAFIAAYNGLPWNYKWQRIDAIAYLEEYTGAARYAGLMIIEDGNVCGAMLGHGKTWWTGHQFMIDEIFIDPAQQGKGYGKLLLKEVERYTAKNGFSTVTLMTNKYMPAFKFYNSIDFSKVEQYVFMFKTL